MNFLLYRILSFKKRKILKSIVKLFNFTIIFRANWNLVVQTVISEGKSIIQYSWQASHARGGYRLELSLGFSLRGNDRYVT